MIFKRSLIFSCSRTLWQSHALPAECHRMLCCFSLLNQNRKEHTSLSTSGVLTSCDEKDSDTKSFDETDPIMALEKIARKSMEEVQAIKQEEKINALSTAESHAGAYADVVTGRNSVELSQQRRRSRRRRTVDNILGDVLNDALRLRDVGKKPNVDFIYKRTQERLYEEEYGKKPPSAKEHAAKYIPFPPDFHLHRILPLFPEYDRNRLEESHFLSASASSPEPATVFRELHDDPWPERCVSPTNPVWTEGEKEVDKKENNGKKLKEWEEKLFLPRDGFDVVGEFLDAADELAHWEAELLHFFRSVPLTQRRSLPYLHEWHRMFVHRTIRAERRYTATRNAALASVKASSALYQRTEEVIDRVRAIYAEAHRSLSSANYDPLRIKKSTLAPFLKMSSLDFEEWKKTEKQKRQILVAELT